MRCCSCSLSRAALFVVPAVILVGVLSVGAGSMLGFVRKDRQPAEAVSVPVAEGDYVLGYTMKRIDGTPESLETYRGKVLLMVNVASRCGLTPQYEALEKLHDEKAEAGLVVMGFPANDFLGQEPGTNEEIAEFCSTKFGVSFPMFEKIRVKGKEAHPLFKQLAREMEEQGGEPSWNFTKYLVDRSGRVVARFGPRTRPDSEEVVAKIDELLAATP